MDAIREGAHQACLLPYITLFYTLGEKLDSYVGDLRKKKKRQTLEWPNPVYYI